MLETDDYQRIWQQYDESVLSFRKYTGKIAGTKLSVTGFLFFIFSKKDKAETFRSQYMDKYKKFHLWKQTWIIPWGIDIANQTIIKHNGLPILTSSIIGKLVGEPLLHNSLKYGEVELVRWNQNSFCALAISTVEYDEYTRSPDGQVYPDIFIPYVASEYMKGGDPVLEKLLEYIARSGLFPK